MYIDPIIEAPLRAAMLREDPRWFTAGGPRLVNHPADKGGLTYGGITATSWGAYRALGRPATADELKAITPDEALAFYYQQYVVVPQFTAIPCQKLRAQCIDWAFTSWMDDPWKAVQTSLQARGHYTDRIDGIPGRNTRAALLNDRNPKQTYRDVCIARVKFYVDLALRDVTVRAYLAATPKSQLHNLRGWTNRALEFTP